MTTSQQTHLTGSLTIVGTGIESIGQITLQALSHIEAASKVFYCVVDPATEAFILTKNKNCVDLYQFYDNGKHRMDTYLQMAEVMLKEVRNGLNVVGVFYGHPGVFVNPSHRALAIAESEGYKARMLPGVSAEDCLFADLGIDPSNSGCLTYEASDFLLRDRPVNMYSHFVLWQVGCVGVADFSFHGFDNNKLDVLVDRLEQEYGADHPVVHYIAAVLPSEDSVVDKLTISQLRDPLIAKRVCGISTFYIPPKEIKDTSMNAVNRLKLDVSGQAQSHFRNFPPNKWGPAGSVANVAPYGPKEQAVIAQLNNHTVPENFPPIDTSKAMTEVMTKLALDPNFLAEFKADQHAVAQSIPDLTPNEREALEKGSLWAVRNAMKKVPNMPEDAHTMAFPVAQDWVAVVPIWVSISDMTYTEN